MESSDPGSALPWVKRLEQALQEVRPLRIEEAIGLDGSNNLLEGYLFLLFEKGSAEPSLFVKLTDDPDLRPALESEYANLQKLKRLLPKDLAERIPEPLWQGTIDGFYVAIRAVLPGDTLKNVRPSKLFSKTRIVSTLEGLSDWLLKFYESSGLAAASTQVSDRWTDIEIDRLYLDFFIHSREEKRLVNEAWARVREALASGLTLVPRHWDLCTANIIVSKGGMGIIDWEMPLEPSLPLFDLFYLCSSTRCLGSTPFDTGGHFESFKRAYFTRNYLSLAVKDVITKHGRRLGIGPILLPHLFIAAQTELAVLKYQKALASHRMDQNSFSGGEESEEAREKRWTRVPLDSMDLPMSCISGGKCLNIRYTAEHADQLTLTA